MILEVTNLRKEFGEIVATDNLSFSLEQGTVRAIIGPNGAGKTTFFNLLTGTLPADDGRIRFKDEDITEKNVHEIARMGMVRKFQTASVYDDLTIEENFQIAADPDRIPDRESRIDDAMEQVNLQDRAGELAGSLDHGNKQWLEIGMILTTDPDLLLLDEPTAGMTVEETNRTVDLIDDLSSRDDMSILVIEHDMRFVRALKTTVTVLHQGAVLAEGHIDEIENNNQVEQVYLGE